MKNIRIIFNLLMLAFTATLSAASSIDVSVITCMPGSEIYELEGHAGIRIVISDSITGSVVEDCVVDWGNFDFAAPNFVYRFVKGETDYSIGVKPTNQFFAYYSWQGRNVYEQKLNLTDDQKQKLLDIINENLLEQNRIYRYNYVKDNCSTRIVDVIERTAGDSINFSPSGLKAVTFRQAMTDYHKNYPWYQFGINLALGSPLDAKIDDRLMMFSPEALHRMLDGAKYANGGEVISASLRPVVCLSDTAVLGPTPWYLTPLAVSVLIFLISIIVCFADLKSHTISRWYYSVLYGIFGLLGCVLTFLIFISVHEATSPNFLYLWLNPLCLLPAVGVWVKKAKKLVFYYQIVNFVLLLALLIVFIIGIQQPDKAFYPLIVADMIASACYIRNYKCSIKRQ